MLCYPCILTRAMRGPPRQLPRFPSFMEMFLSCRTSVGTATEGIMLLGDPIADRGGCPARAGQPPLSAIGSPRSMMPSVAVPTDVRQDKNISMKEGNLGSCLGGPLIARVSIQG